MLSERQLLLLKTIIKEYVRTAQPLGSKTLTSDYGLPYSSATIRNEMAFLEQIGFLQKTHTSSGRIPSELGYRYYVDYLMDLSLDDSIKDHVEKLFESRQLEISSVIQETCDIVSQLTNYTSVSIGSHCKNDVVAKIELLQISENGIVATIITDKGHIESRHFNMNKPLSITDISKINSLLNASLKGVAICEVIEKLQGEIIPQVNTKFTEYESIFSAFLQMFTKFINDDIYFAGKTNMLYQPDFEDLDKIRNVMSALEDMTIWQQLENIDQGISITIGSENSVMRLHDVAIISSKFYSSNGQEGTLAVIGPVRMEYNKVVALLEYISLQLTEKLQKENESR